jgi:hypothetical protein
MISYVDVLTILSIFFMPIHNQRFKNNWELSAASSLPLRSC